MGHITNQYGFNYSYVSGRSSAAGGPGTFNEGRIEMKITRVCQPSPEFGGRTQRNLYSASTNAYRMVNSDLKLRFSLHPSNLSSRCSLPRTNQRTIRGGMVQRMFNHNDRKRLRHNRWSCVRHCLGRSYQLGDGRGSVLGKNPGHANVSQNAIKCNVFKKIGESVGGRRGVLVL